MLARPPFPTPPAVAGVRGWVDPEWSGAPRGWRAAPGDALERIEGLDAEPWLRRMPGRVTFAVDLDGERVVVKRFRGDLLRERLFERFLGGGPRSPARREGENLRLLRAAGFRVPRPLAWFERGGRGAVVMELIAHEATLRSTLGALSWRERRELGAEVLAIAARLHSAGWYHRDLYLDHFVVPSDGSARLALLDLGRARRQARPKRWWLTKDLGALLFSAPPDLGPRERLRALALYLDARGISDRRARRRWAREVAAQARYIASRPPKHVDTRGVGPK